MKKSKEEIEGLGNLYLINETRKWVGDDIPDVYTQDDMIKAVAWGYDEGFYDATKWHYPSKGEYPPVGEFDATSHLVLVFWWDTDCKGKKAKVYGLDRWCEQHKEWDNYPQHPIAWMPLPEPPKEEA